MGRKFQVPSQKALKTPNGTSAYRRLVCSKITGGRAPHSQIRVGSHQWGDEKWEAGVPGITAVDIECTEL